MSTPHTHPFSSCTLSTAVGTLHFRPATEADIPFLLALRKQTMQAHFDATGVQVSEAEHVVRVRAAFDAALIIMRGDEMIGLCKVLCEPTQWELVQVQFLPAYQGKGLGTALLQALIQAARSAGAGVRLDVLKANPAKRLYERMGFAVFAETADSFLMQTGA